MVKNRKVTGHMVKASAHVKAMNLETMATTVNAPLVIQTTVSQQLRHNAINVLILELHDILTEQHANPLATITKPETTKEAVSLVQQKMIFKQHRHFVMFASMLAHKDFIMVHNAFVH